MNAELVDDVSFVSAVEEAHFIVAFHHPSSVQFEALSEGRSMILLEPSDTLGRLTLPCSVDELFLSVRSPEELRSLMISRPCLGLGGGFRSYFLASPGGAAARIVNEIAGLLSVGAHEGPL